MNSVFFFTANPSLITWLTSNDLRQQATLTPSPTKSSNLLLNSTTNPLPQRIWLRHLHLPPLPHPLHRRLHQNSPTRRMSRRSHLLLPQRTKKVCAISPNIWWTIYARGKRGDLSNYFACAEKVAGVHDTRFRLLSSCWLTQLNTTINHLVKRNDNKFTLRALRTWREVTRLHYKPTINYLVNRNNNIILNIV